MPSAYCSILSYCLLTYYCQYISRRFLQPRRRCVDKYDTRVSFTTAAFHFTLRRLVSAPRFFHGQSPPQIINAMPMRAWRRGASPECRRREESCSATQQSREEEASAQIPRSPFRVSASSLLHISKWAKRSAASVLFHSILPFRERCHAQSSRASDFDSWVTITRGRCFLALPEGMMLSTMYGRNYSKTFSPPR